MITRKIGISETSKNVWRVTYDGRTLGDSRGMTKEGAIAEARRIAAISDDGDWQGGTWVNRVNVLDLGASEERRPGGGLVHWVIVDNR